MKKLFFFTLLLLTVTVSFVSCTLLEDAAHDGIVWTVLPGNALSVSRIVSPDSPQDTIFPKITLGLKCNGLTLDCSKMVLESISKPETIREKEYTSVSGKKSVHAPVWRESVLKFAPVDGYTLSVIIRTSSDGFAFRYELVGKDKTPVTFTEELTRYTFAEHSDLWAQRAVTSYEDFYLPHTPKDPAQNWNYPVLLRTPGNTWGLITESGMDGTYCATKLRNCGDGTAQLLYPERGEGAGQGEVNPVAATPWRSPWRVVIAGGLNTIVESSIVDELAPESSVKDTSWIHLGKAAWVYWAYNHGSKDFKIVKDYIDLAAKMKWPYVLIDWEWDVMGNGGKLEDAIAYAQSQKVDVLLWYNSGGKHNWVSCGPRDRLLTHESRIQEFRNLKKLGVKGIKVDFFESDKQSMIQYYLDILKDAADEKFLINFHGCTIPRGWSRTYPNLVSMEAVYGAEQYNNGSRMTEEGANHNAMLPFTRNVVGPMDYTPVAFTDSQHKHTTKHVHELALTVIFESAIEHMADRPSSFLSLPDIVHRYLEKVPTTWDETKFIEGFPGEWIVMARRKGNSWYIAGINGSEKERTVEFPKMIPELNQQKNVQAIRFSDTPAGNVFDVKKGTVSELFPVKLEKKGGFIIWIER